MTTLLNSAKAFRAVGLCVIPAKADASKAPFAAWKEYQTRLPTATEVDGWFANGTFDGLGLVCGAVSGGLEMLEAEGRAMSSGAWATVEQLAEASGLGELWARVTNGYLELTPAGGMHLLYRVSDMALPGNVKLAKDADGLVLAETRSEGGFTIVAPSAGRTHPNGSAWTLLRGGPDSIAVITGDERDALHLLFRTLDRTPEPVAEPFRPRNGSANRPAGGTNDETLQPGDDYNQRAAWPEILEPHGWARVYTAGAVTYWRRPGKAQGISATTGRNDGDNLYVFSSSTPFDQEKPYSKFGALATLEHGGDFSACAKWLRSENYGAPLPPPSRDELHHLIAPPEPKPAPVPAGEEPQWRIPDPLHDDVPAFPTQALGWLEPATLALSEELQTPPDLVGMLLLAATAAAVRGRIRVGITAGWDEPLNLYTAVVLAAGETKSPALARLIKPLRDIEAQLIETAAPQVADAAQKRRMQEKRVRAAEDRAVKAGGDDRYVAEEEARQEQATLDLLPDPVSPRLLVGDVTPEGLVRLLAEQGGAMASMSAEGGLFDTFAAGRYSNGLANLDAILQAHDGREAILVDRKGGEPLRVEQPCLTIGLAVQPQVLEAIGDNEAAHGRGFLARWLYSVPTSRVGTRAVDNRVDSPLLADLDKAVNGTYRIAEGGCECFEDASLISRLELSSSSLVIHRRYRKGLEGRRHPDTGDLADIVGWANKLDGQLARLAGLLHLLDLTEGLSLGNPSSKHSQPGSVARIVPESAMSRAVVLADYLIEHARAAHRLMAPGAGQKAAERQVLGWATARSEPLAEFSLREAHQHLRGRVMFHDVEAVEASLDKLVIRGYLAHREPEKGKPGRPASPRYLVNPLAIGAGR